MKKIVLSFIISLFVLLTNGQVLTQTNFTGNIVPQVMGSLTATRLPFIYRATLTGLAPNTLYRYFTNLAIRTDIGTTNSGAGNNLFISTSDIRYTTTSSVNILGGYDSLTTNSSGSYTGWFATVNTGNTRFTGGNYLFPSIVLDSAGSKRGIINSRFCFATDSVLVLTYATASGASNGSFIRGNSSGTAKNLVLLFQDTVSTNRPLSIGIIESIGTTIASIVPDYAANVQAVSGAWGTIIPNTLPNGVRRIEQRSLITGSYINGSKSTNGTWGTTNTVNPLNGATALVIASTNAPLPVKLTSFIVEINNNQTELNWSTASETNNKGFEVEKSIDGVNFETIGFIRGNGNSNRINKYSFIDANQSSAYYRLKQIDFDGQFEYSSTVKVNSDELSIELNPNPFNDNLVISSASNIVNAEIIDVNGKTKIMEILNNNKASINTSSLSNGIYFIRINNGETVITKRIIKN